MDGAMQQKAPDELPCVGIGCPAYLTLQGAPGSNLVIICCRNAHSHDFPSSDKYLLGLPAEVDLAVSQMPRGVRLTANMVSVNAEDVIARDVAYARQVVVGLNAVKQPVKGLISGGSHILASPGRVGNRGRGGWRTQLQQRCASRFCHLTLRRHH
jgi:hypothetical protein